MFYLIFHQFPRRGEGVPSATVLARVYTSTGPLRHLSIRYISAKAAKGLCFHHGFICVKHGFCLASAVPVEAILIRQERWRTPMETRR